MIKINFKYNKETHTGFIPSTWNEMKVRHYLALEGTTEPLQLLSLLTDLDLSFILNTSTDLTPYLNQVIKLINQQPELDRSPKRRVWLRGAWHKIPGSLDKITFGQSAIIEQELAKVDGNEVLALAPIMAVVMQPIIDKAEFNLEESRELEAEILELPMNQVLGNVVFFWRVLSKYLIFGAPNLARYLPQTL